MQNQNARERDVERRLRRLENPEPPVDLLDRIRDDIPEYLRPVGEAETRGPNWTRGHRLAAASLLLAVTGGFLAYQVLRQSPDPMSSVAIEVGPEEPVSAETSLEATVSEPPADATDLVVSTAPTEGDEDIARRQSPVGRSLPPVTPEPTPPAAIEVGQQEIATAEQRSEILGTGADLDRNRADTAPTLEDREELSALGHIDEAKANPAPPPTPVASAVNGVREGASEPRRRQALQDRLKKMEIGVSPPPASSSPPTGGTAVPNDQPWGDMFFRPYGTNPFVDTEDDAQSTFGLDVDTGSYTLARSYLERGHLPPPEAIRVEEFVNFFDYRDPAPRRGEFTLTAEAAPSPWQRGPRYQLLRIGVRGRSISAAQRKDATLVFVVDVSGSMAREDRIQLVKQALHLLLDQLGAGDRVGLVVYGSQGRVLLEPSGDLRAVRRAIDRLSTGGSTNAEEGLLLGYQLARRHFRPESINRLVLCSDGVANVGNTGPESILARIGREAEDGIELTTVGFGMGNYNDVLMEQLADQGDGNYAYVDTLQEARRVFVENLTGTLQTIASDAKIQVEFDPQVVSRYRLLGYENRDVADHRFRDDTVDAGEIGAGHRVTALYEIKLADRAPRRRTLAEVRLRYRSQATGRVVEDALEIGQTELARSWHSASPSLRLAALAAELAEVLKQSYWARQNRPEELRERARAVGRDFGDDPDVVELIELTNRVSALVDWTAAPTE
jgi:Ca-activated chloride channel family protein